MHFENSRGNVWTFVPELHLADIFNCMFCSHGTADSWDPTAACQCLERACSQLQIRWLRYDLPLPGMGMREPLRNPFIWWVVGCTCALKFTTIDFLCLQTRVTCAALVHANPTLPTCGFIGANHLGPLRTMPRSWTREPRWGRTPTGTSRWQPVRVSSSIYSECFLKLICSSWRTCRCVCSCVFMGVYACLVAYGRMRACIVLYTKFITKDSGAVSAHHPLYMVPKLLIGLKQKRLGGVSQCDWVIEQI